MVVMSRIPDYSSYVTKCRIAIWRDAEMLQLIRDGNCEDIGHTEMTRHGTRALPQQWDINSASFGSLDPWLHCKFC